MDKWKIIHAYRKLAAQGKAEKWTCPVDEQPMVSRGTNGDEPYLWCYTCNGKIHPGLVMYEKMTAIVEAFDEAG